MAIVIGLDLGNFNSYPSYISDLEPDRSRLGGRAVDLYPPTERESVPSVFFYDGKGRFLAGRAAVTGAAKPERNRLRYLKRSLGKPLKIGDTPVTIDGRNWTYDDAIREVAQAVLREANRELERTIRETTNLVALAYPATYSSAQRERLIQIVNSASLEDGRRFQVVGTIMEPAAAALDYLSQSNLTEDTTVMVFDLGGGTFDLSLVTCYPKGKKRADGTTAYYDIHLTDGLPKIGGHEFDEVIYSLLLVKLVSFLKKNKLTRTVFLDEQIRLNAEKVKKELTDSDRTVYETYIPALDDYVSFELTRKEFENAPRVQEMLRQMTGKARELLSTAGYPKPKRIVLTGGSCRMPMIRKALIKALPEYAKLIDENEYKPETAISYGAARYGVPEPSSDVVTGGRTGGAVEIQGPHSVIKRVAYDIGLRYFNHMDDNTGFITCLIPRGSELPFTSYWSTGRKLNDSQYSTKKLYEAVSKTPDSNKPDRDYRFIKQVSVDFGRSMPKGTPSEARLVVDKDGIVTLEARKDSKSPLFTVTAQLTTTFD